MNPPFAICLPLPHARQNAFSLLEMAIVIVIIGLLVGGLVGARSYVKNAQYTTMINETKYYINAFGQFQTMYASVPGDMGNAANYWTSAHNGDGNGFIRAVVTGTDNKIEQFYAFEHLADAGFIKGHFTGATAGGAGTFTAKPNVNISASSVNRVVYYFDHPDALDGNVGNADATYFPSGTSGIYDHVLIAAAMPAATSAMPVNGAFLTPKDAAQLDAKYDDGLPGTGWIMTPNRTALSSCTVAGTGGAADSYNTGSDALACYLVLRLH